MNIIIFFILFISSTVYAQSLIINSVEFTKEKLINLATENIQTLDPTYKGKVSFKAIDFSKVITVSKDKSVKFKALDGFTSIIPGSYFHGNSKAFIAVEDKKWPERKEGTTAGPYYLIWTNPQVMNIKQEQWPFQISEISIVENVEIKYKKINPDSLSFSAKKGFKIFTQNCFVCHKLNGLGEGTMGPDLNIPMNPTEYLKLSAFKKLIRDPKSVRRWKGMKMPNFDQKAISDKELLNLINYLIEIKDVKSNKDI